AVEVVLGLQVARQDLLARDEARADVPPELGETLGPREEAAHTDDGDRLHDGSSSSGANRDALGGSRTPCERSHETRVRTAQPNMMFRAIGTTERLSARSSHVPFTHSLNA